MKIFKVILDPSNPVEKIVKVPVGSNYGIQINWNYEKYPTFVGTDINTENGFLTDSLGKIEENTSFTEVNGQKIFTGLHVIEEVGNTIVLYYGKNETYDDNKLDNFGSIKVVGVDSDDYDVDVGGGDATIEGISFENNELTLSAQTISLTGDVKINGEEYQSGSSFEYITEEEGKVVLSVNSVTTVKFQDYMTKPSFVSDKGIGIFSTQQDAVFYATNGTARVTGQTGLALNAMNNNVDITVPNGCVLINGTNIAEIAGGSGGGSIEGISPDSWGGGPLSGIVGKGLVVGYPDFSCVTIVNGSIVMLASDTNGTNMRLDQGGIYTTGANLIQMNAPTINIVNYDTNDCINICSQTINLNGTVYINGEQYQAGGGSSVDYIYSKEYLYTNCINLFIGNTDDAQYNDKVYINGCNIIIGSEIYHDDGENIWGSGNKTNNLCLKATYLDFCIDTDNGGSWKINGYRIKLEDFLNQFGEYVG